LIFRYYFWKKGLKSSEKILEINLYETLKRKNGPEY